jgi:hypothetical protein
VSLAFEFDLDAAVGQTGGQLADAGQLDRSPGREAAGLLILALAADHKSGGAAVAAVFTIGQPLGLAVHQPKIRVRECVMKRLIQIAQRSPS